MTSFTHGLTPTRLALLLGAAALATSPQIASAQIDEIVVTAQRQAESILDVPVALTVLDADALETQQIQETLDLQAFVPNLNIGTNTGTANAARIFLRGVGEDESRGAVEPAVGTYIDGVYISRAVGALFDLVDLEQVEVLRGPQGTLYGRNSNGGAIKITSKKPDAEAFSADGRLTYGNYERFEAKGTVNIPVADSTAIRVSGLFKERDGFFDINPNGALAAQSFEGVGAVNTVSVRGMISHDFNPDWNVTLIADFTDDDSDPIPSTVADEIDADGNLFTVEPTVGTSCATVTPDLGAPAGPFQFTRPVGCFGGFSNETKSEGYSGTISGKVGGFDVQSITAYRALEDDLSAHIGFPFAQQTDQDQFSQELTLASNYDGMFNFIVGGFYFTEDLVFDSIFVFPFNVTTDVESIAVFGQGYVEVDDFTFTGGLRYTDESRDFAGTNLASGLGVDTEQDSDNISYTAKLDWAANESTLIYGSYTTGFKGAGFSPDCFSPTACFLPVSEEEVATLEFGVRSQFFDDRMRISATVFDNQYDDLQIAASVPGLGFTRFNVDETQIRGAEFEFTFAPTPDFELSANLGLLDGEYQAVTLSQAGGLTNNGAGCTPGQDLVDCALGLELKNAPDWKGNIAARYTWSPEDLPGDVTFSGNVAFEDDSFSLVANSPFNADSNIPTLANARIGFTPDDSFWNVALWARNIFDEEYYRVATGNANAVYASQPGTYGIDLGFNF